MVASARGNAGHAAADRRRSEAATWACRGARARTPGVGVAGFVRHFAGEEAVGLLHAGVENRHLPAGAGKARRPGRRRVGDRHAREQGRARQLVHFDADHPRCRGQPVERGPVDPGGEERQEIEPRPYRDTGVGRARHDIVGDTGHRRALIGRGGTVETAFGHEGRIHAHDDAQAFTRSGAHGEGLGNRHPDLALGGDRQSPRHQHDSKQRDGFGHRVTHSRKAAAPRAGGRTTQAWSV